MIPAGPGWTIVRRATTPRVATTSDDPYDTGGSQYDMCPIGNVYVPFAHHHPERSMSIDTRLARAEASHRLARAQNARPVHTMVSAPRPIRPARERRARRRRQTVRGLLLAILAGIGIALGTVGALMPQSVRHALDGAEPAPTASAWAADATGCLTNTITGAVACPVVTEGEN